MKRLTFVITKKAALKLLFSSMSSFPGSIKLLHIRKARSFLFSVPLCFFQSLKLFAFLKEIFSNKIFQNCKKSTDAVAKV